MSVAVVKRSVNSSTEAVLNRLYGIFSHKEEATTVLLSFAEKEDPSPVLLQSSYPTYASRGLLVLARR